MVNAVIADDESLLCQHLKNLLQRLWPELNIVGIANNGGQAVDLIRTLKPDVAFLDLKMPVYDGLQVALQVGDICHIVFVTAHDDYAVEAFEIDALDYVVKPIDEQRLQKTITRIKNKKREEKRPLAEWQTVVDHVQNHPNQVLSQNYIKWIKVNHKEDTRLIAVQDVLYFSSEDKYTTVVTQDREYLIRKSIKELEAELDPEVFWRIHRGTLVNTEYIAVARKSLNGRYTVHLKDSKTTLTVSRNFAYHFKQM